MNTMTGLLRHGRASHEVMAGYAVEDARRGRNDPCICGSRREGKHCPGASPGPGVMAAKRISVLRVRIGILLFLLWWLPVYLLAPAIANLIGTNSDANLVREVTIWLICIQTVIGLIGLYLAGKELFATLGKVRRRRVLAVAWHIVRTGDTHVADSDLRPPKAEARKSKHAPGAPT